VGFTGGTGGLTAIQDIQKWDFIPITSGGAPASPSTPGAGGAAPAGVGGIASGAPTLSGSPSGAVAGQPSFLVGGLLDLTNSGTFSTNPFGTIYVSALPVEASSFGRSLLVLSVPNPDTSLVDPALTLTAGQPSNASAGSMWVDLTNAPATDELFPLT
jgi:hypothetical protein